MVKEKTPTGQFDPKKIRELKLRKENDKADRELDRSRGRDTRMSRDGGTSRRVRR